MRKICVITGSRAEYGLLSGLMAKIQFDRDLQLQIIATNMHLSPEFCLTYKEIETDGFRIDKKVEMLLSSDTANGTAKSVGLATIGFADAFEDLSPDLILVLGDRFEILAAVSAALFYKIPVAHIHGGEITEGAYDDNIRHAITKMSHLHFTSAEPYRRRVGFLMSVLLEWRISNMCLYCPKSSGKRALIFSWEISLYWSHSILSPWRTLRPNSNA